MVLKAKSGIILYGRMMLDRDEIVDHVKLNAKAQRCLVDHKLVEQKGKLDWCCEQNVVFLQGLLMKRGQHYSPGDLSKMVVKACEAQKLIVHGKDEEKAEPPAENKAEKAAPENK